MRKYLERFVVYAPPLFFLFVVVCLNPIFGSHVAYVANEDSNTISVIDTSSNLTIGTIALSGSPKNFLFTPDESKAYVFIEKGGGNNFISVIDVSTSSVTNTFVVGASRVPYPMAITSDGSLLYAANGITNTVSVIDTATDTLSTTISVGDRPYAISFTSDGTKAYVCNVISNNISVIDVANSTVSETIAGVDAPNNVLFNSEDTKAYIFSALPSFGIIVIDAISNSILTNILIGSGFGSGYNIILSADNSTLYALGLLGLSGVGVFDVINNTLTTTISLTGIGSEPLISMAITPDNAKLYVPESGNDVVAVIDLATNTVSTTIAAGNAPFSVAMHPDGTYVYVTNSGDDTVSVIDVATDTVVSTAGVGGNPRVIRVSPQNIEPTPLDPAADRLLRAWQLAPISFQNDPLD